MCSFCFDLHGFSKSKDLDALLESTSEGAGRECPRSAYSTSSSLNLMENCTNECHRQGERQEKRQNNSMGSD